MAIVVNAENQFALRKCKPGTLAMHAEHGIVRVVRASGAARTIEVDRYEVEESGNDNALSSAECDLFHCCDGMVSERLYVSEFIVRVADLVELNPFNDREPAPAANVLKHSFV